MQGIMLHLYLVEKSKNGLNGWASMDSHIKNTKTNSKITDDVITRLFGLVHTITKDETLPKLQQIFKHDFVLYQSTNNAVKLFWPKESFELPISSQEILNLLNIHIEKPTLTERDKIIISIAEGKYSKYINEVETILADSELHVCPLCQRELSDSEKVICDRESVSSLIKVQKNIGSACIVS